MAQSLLGSLIVSSNELRCRIPCPVALYFLFHDVVDVRIQAPLLLHGLRSISLREASGCLLISGSAWSHHCVNGGVSCLHFRRLRVLQGFSRRSCLRKDDRAVLALLLSAAHVHRKVHLHAFLSHSSEALIRTVHTLR